MGSELTGKFLQNEFFPRQILFLSPERIIEQNPEISTRFRSKIFVERPKQAKSVILLDFSRIFAIQILSGLASPYTWPISTIPSYHPSL